MKVHERVVFGMLLDFEGFPKGHTLSHGWVYDAARELVYVVNTNKWAVWALRMDPKTVNMLTAEPLADAAEGAERLGAYAAKLPAAAAGTVEIIPPGEKIKPGRPRMLLRPRGSQHAIGLDQIKALKRDDDFKAGLKTLKASRRADAQAMVWLLTGDDAAAEKALARLSGYYVVPEDAFDVWFGLRELSLAYDWLHGHPKFTGKLKAKVRDRAFVLVEKWGLPKGDDHVFHNYTWMNNCGLAMWALASYGDDPRSKPLMDIVRYRMNGRLFPAMEHLNGLAGDAMGYWFIYCPASCIWTLMAVQSAYGIDAMTPIREKQNDWLTAQLECSIHGTLPNMRFMPWGDMQAGADGGVTHEWAGPADAATWALDNPHGARFGNWLADKRGMRRFHKETAILYFLYTRHIATAPKEPPLAMLAGGTHSAQAMMRSSWKDDATVVGFRCTDYYQGHFHHDAGSFVVYRNGLLAVDAGRYTRYTRELRAPIIATSAHNSLLLGGRGQRVVKGQWYKDLAEFNKARKDRRDGRRLEFGDVPFYKHAGDWTAVAGQFAQAYKPGVVKSCVRQLLYVRPNTLVVVDHLVPAAGKKLPEVTWLLNVAREKLEIGKGTAATANETSWLRCRSLTSEARPTVEKSPPTQLTRDHRKQTEIARVSFVYPEQPGERTLAHLVEVGDGKPGAAADVTPKISAHAVEIRIDGKTFVFSKTAPFAVEAR
ncbi:MAG: heparinase II/III family protein [Planctomycetota bacterium]